MAGHPIHPALVHFPFGLLFSSVLIDLAHWAGLWPETRFAAWLMAGGLATALLAMAAGLYDFRRLNDAQVPYALRHTAAMGVAWLGFAVALYLRRDVLAARAEPPTVSVLLALGSAVALGFGGWLGGELVYRHGAGRIDP
jgi:uncharacterized membrane protein